MTQSWRGIEDAFTGLQIVYQCWTGYSCLGLAPLCPVRIVACADDSRTHDLIAKRLGIQFFSPAQSSNRRGTDRIGNTDRIFSCAKEETRRILRRETETRWIFAGVSSPDFCDFAAEMGCRFVGNPADLRRFLNDKANFFAGLDQLKLPRIAGTWLRLTEHRYSDLASSFGSNFVVQLARGYSGSGTTFVGSESAYAAAGARCGNSPAWVTPDLGHLSLNVNALALEAGTVVAWPSVQLVGVDALGSSRGMYCGNDYCATAALPPALLTDVAAQTDRIGGWLASLGFRGLFGLDFVVDSSTAFAVDLNPRWQGSTTPLALAESRSGRLPLAVADVACALGVLSQEEILRRKDEFIEPVRVAQLALRCKGLGWYKVGGSLWPGVYQTSVETRFRRPGLQLNDLQDPGDVLLTAGIPRPGSLIQAQADMPRILSGQQAIDMARMALLPWGQAAARAAYDSLALTPAP